jgi:hypothetical protein|tara:strand:+ start:1850 stop:2224 length:375 start_codon:yes stop_codon:yes gene_type:complete
VFSIVDNDDNVSESLIKCNNCGITHKIIELSKSEVLEKSDDWQTVNKEDVRLSLNPGLREILDSYNVDLPTWQMAQWIVDTSQWGTKMILSKKDYDDRIEGKFLVFKDLDQYRIETFLEDKNEF